MGTRAGLPDIGLLRDGRCFWIELKAEDGRITKEDVVAAAAAKSAAPAASATAPAAPAPAASGDRGEERVKMTRLRQTIARRLKEAQNTAAMLTTFNEVDMKPIMDLRAQYKDLFEKKHGVKLGFMGFFTKACVQALKDIPAVNAEIDGGDLIDGRADPRFGCSLVRHDGQHRLRRNARGAQHRNPQLCPDIARPVFQPQPAVPDFPCPVRPLVAQRQGQRIGFDALQQSSSVLAHSGILSRQRINGVSWNVV